MAPIALNNRSLFSLKQFGNIIFVQKIQKQSAKLESIVLMVISKFSRRDVSNWQRADLASFRAQEKSE